MDMDGVLVDWTAQFESDLARFYPEYKFDMLREFSTPTHLSQEHQDAINWVKTRIGFYKEMRPIPGAIDAVVEMAEQHDVWLCSSPEVLNASCESDKKTWVRLYMGDYWANRLILTKDKTMVRGDLLIDDRPDVGGIMEPEWEHILFSQPYNDHVKDKIRLDGWTDWRSVMIGAGE